jgi:hypothetical protein
MAGMSDETYLEMTLYKSTAVAEVLSLRFSNEEVMGFCDVNRLLDAHNQL